MVTHGPNLNRITSETVSQQPSRLLLYINRYVGVTAADDDDFVKRLQQFVVCHLNALAIGSLLSIYTFWVGHAPEVATVFAVGVLLHAVSLFALGATQKLFPLAIFSIAVHICQLTAFIYLLGGIHATPIFVWWASLPVIAYFLLTGPIIWVVFSLPIIVSIGVLILDALGIVWPIRFSAAHMDQFVLISTMLCLLHLTALIAVFRLSQRDLETVLRANAELDSLTLALNHGAFVRFAKRELRLCQRNQQPCAVAVLDVDLFKEVNDSFGHAAGDQALITIVSHCRNTLRDTDDVGRLGGDEFAVILPGATAETAAIVMQRVRTAIQSTAISGMEDQPLSISVGVSEWQPGMPECSAADLIAVADKALYEVKCTGRGQVLYTHSVPISDMTKNIKQARG